MKSLHALSLSVAFLLCLSLRISGTGGCLDCSSAICMAFLMLSITVRSLTVCSESLLFGTSPAFCICLKEDMGFGALALANDSSRVDCLCVCEDCGCGDDGTPGGGSSAPFVPIALVFVKRVLCINIYYEWLGFGSVVGMLGVFRGARRGWSTWS